MKNKKKRSIKLLRVLFYQLLLLITLDISIVLLMFNTILRAICGKSIEDKDKDEDKKLEIMYRYLRRYSSK